MKSATLTDLPASSQPSSPALFDRADYFILTAAVLSFLLSIVLWFGGPFGAPNKDGGLFVAVWVPSILSLGCFAKLAKKERRHG